MLQLLHFVSESDNFFIFFARKKKKKLVNTLEVTFFKRIYINYLIQEYHYIKINSSFYDKLK